MPCCRQTCTASSLAKGDRQTCQLCFSCIDTKARSQHHCSLCLGAKKWVHECVRGAAAVRQVGCRFLQSGAKLPAYG